MKNVALGTPEQNVVLGREEKKGHSSNPDRRTERPSPRPRRSHYALGYDAFADDVRQGLNPRGPLETMVAEQVIESAWLLKTTSDRRAARADVTGGNPDKAPATSRRITASERALRSMKDALETLDDLQARRARVSPPIEPSPVDSEPDPAEVVFDPFFDGDSSDWSEAPFGVEAAEAADVVPPIWEDRLVFDFEVSDISPVVKGTWVTVSHVVSLIVDGHTWADILRTHPELNEEDVHACMAYALDEQNDPK
jgi:uncharacterized protein (DUF433 family)